MRNGVVSSRTEVFDPSNGLEMINRTQSIASTPTYLQPKREKHPEDLQLKSIEKAKLFLALSTTVQ